jgi:hypothetical protein
MPRGDGTGPMGMGAMTGRGAGYCAGTGSSGDDNAAPGRNAGLGFGGNRRPLGRGGAGRRGRRNRYYVTGLAVPMPFPGSAASSPSTDPAKEKQLLEQQAKTLQSELDQIKKRLGEMEAVGGD